MTHRALALATLALAAAPALAEAPLATSDALTYATFEITVPHLDLDACPEALAAPDVFCRAAAAHAEVVVFAFSMEGEQPLVATATYAPEAFATHLR